MDESAAAGPYAEIGRHQPNLPLVGGTYMGITETVAGHERAFNRWYEDDHFYSGAMAGPWILAGRRWVATHELRKTWIPADSPVISPSGQGCYFKTYWFAAGHEHDAETWMNEAFKRLAQEEERFPTMRFGSAAEPRVKRNSVYSSFQRHLFTSTRDAGPLRAVHALDYPFRGLALDIVRCDADPGGLGKRLQAGVGAALEHASGKLAMCFRRAANQWLPSARGQLGHEITLLWFFDRPPTAAGYAPLLAGFHETVAGCGGRLALSASFIPTVPGTDMYVDKLRAP